MPTNSRIRPAGLLVLLVAVIGVTAILASTGGSSSDTSDAAGPPPVVASGSPAAAVQDQFVQVVDAVSPRVVQVRSQTGLGSGVVFDDQGDIVTNAHVVAGSSTFQITFPNGNRQQATLVGADRSHDLAVVRVGAGAPSPARFGDSAALQVGDLVLAIGNPLGLRSSVSEGIVSSLDRTVSESDGVTLTTVQTTADINPGNSGGALVDLEGRVVGIPTLSATDPQMSGSQAAGIGFAIPSSTIDAIVPGIISGG
jgi:putative serine protease PepD